MTHNPKPFLIVDDEPDLCWALAHILNKKGIKSETALTGSKAIELVRKTSFEMAFLDAKLPDAEGLELAKTIRKMDASVSVVIVSGYFYRDDVNMQRALGDGDICGFIEKPFLHDEILETIERMRSEDR